MKQYRLLRDNKETGPYTAEELIKKGLKAYDLVWIDGQSAAWRYPSEVPELRAFAPAVEEQPFDRFYNTKPNNKGNQPAPQQPAATQPGTAPRQPQQEPAGGKPRFRIKADLHKVEIVAVNPPAPPPTANTSRAARQETPQPAGNTAQPASDAVMGVGWEEALAEWKNDQHHPTEPAAAAEPTVRYSASLDDIKQRYEETVLNPRKKLEGKQWLRYGLSFLLIPLLGIGMWLGKKWDNKQTAEALHRPGIENNESSKPAEETAAKDGPSVLSGNDLKATDETPAQTPKQQVQAAAHPPVAAHKTQQPLKKTQAAVPPKNAVAKNNALPGKPVTARPLELASKTSIPNNAVNKTAVNKPTVIVTPGKNNAGKLPVTPAVVKETTATASLPKSNAPVANTASNNPVNTATGNTTTAAATPPAPARKRIADYVSVNDDGAAPGSGESMKLHVKNLSNIPVDLVVLDLQYYDAKGRFQKGETMYVNHLGARDEVALQPPAAKNAQKVTYKVSLLSIEKKGIYLIAE